MYGKQLTWENSQKYILFYHHDEHLVDDELFDLIQIKDSGTMLELMDTSPKYRETSSYLSNRTYKRSGLTETILSLDSFPMWFSWFRSQEIYKDYKIELQVEDEEVMSVISSIEI